MIPPHWYLADLSQPSMMTSLLWEPSVEVARAMRLKARRRQLDVMRRLNRATVAACRPGLSVLRNAICNSSAPLAVLTEEFGRQGLATAVQALGSIRTDWSSDVAGSRQTIEAFARHIHVPKTSPNAVPVVALLDSGVDYTHTLFGGPGTSASFERAYGLAFVEAAAARGQALRTQCTPSGLDADASTRTRDKHGTYFPTEKVVAGHDFVGEHWTGLNGGSDEQPNPNPIDINGHGTSTAGIVAALCPEASLVAVKVAASFSPACSVPAALQGLEYCLDYERTGGLAPVDVANLSFGVPTTEAGEDIFSQAVTT